MSSAYVQPYLLESKRERDTSGEKETETLLANSSHFLPSSYTHSRLPFIPAQSQKKHSAGDGTVDPNPKQASKMQQTLAATAMARHRCKLCHRRFANGRALAGHMRSHVPPRPLPLPSPSASSSSPSPAPATHPAIAEKSGSKAVVVLADPELSSSSAVQDRESDAESSLRRRGKPQRRPGAADERMSYVSDPSSEEDIARCLMLLSRDAWSRSEAGERQSDGWDAIGGDEFEENELGEETEENWTGFRSRRRRSRFQCDTCRKLFRSYQALGGHRASHKRVGVECVPITPTKRIHVTDSSGGKIWECPFCYRIFGSGQALGGHKRSHLAATDAAKVSPAPLPRPPTSPAANSNSGINLNLPAPLDDEPELSALSVATEYAHA